MGHTDITFKERIEEHKLDFIKHAWPQNYLTIEKEGTKTDPSLSKTETGICL